QRQPVAGRPAPACGARQGRRPALRRGGRRLLRTPPGEAGDHRLGADQRLARRDPHRGKDPAPRGARSALHRELVGAARPRHPGAHAARARQDRARVLMTNTATATVASPRLSVETLRGALLWLMGFAGAFVFIEPSPYEIVGALAIA